MKISFFKTVRFYSLVVIALGALIAFISLAISGFNLSYLNNSQKIAREDNQKNIYSDNLTNISLIKIDTEHTNVNIIPSKSNEFKATYFENKDEKYSISKSQNVISLTYKNANPAKTNLLQKIPFFKGGNNSPYENNDLTIEIPEVYSGDINLISSEETYDANFKISNLKNINNLNINVTNFVELENISCKNNIVIKTEQDCDLKNVFSDTSIEINTVVGEINLDNVLSKNILDCNSVDGPININKICSNRISLRSALEIVGTVYGNETDYIIKQHRYGDKEITSIENPENKKILITRGYSNIKFAL